MSEPFSELLEKIARLQEQLDDAFEERARRFRYELRNRKVVFEREVLEAHKAFRTRLSQYVLNARFLSIVTAPFIYFVAIPFAFLDLSVIVYQAVCFPVYGIPKVPRGDYIVFDRHRLGYLNAVEKLNCVYCAYGNGLIAWVQEVASRTEAYWCPIKHARRVKTTLPRYARFSDYGSAETYHEDLEKNREAARKGL
ncbi:MAG TPA: hypothetical protein ENI85_06385 [Deltaproteobacteria bacterium]|nr:hypothetical protein [Deltaproteobacteria bacterium]